MFHKRKAVLSYICATLCVRVKQSLNRPGQALRQQEVLAHRRSGKSTHEDSNVASRIIKYWYLFYYSGHEDDNVARRIIKPWYLFYYSGHEDGSVARRIIKPWYLFCYSDHEDGNVASRIIKSWCLFYYSGHENGNVARRIIKPWYLFYYSGHEDGNVASRMIKSWCLFYYPGHEISGPSNKSAHNFPPLICASSKPPRSIFTNKWVFVVDKLIGKCILHIFRKFIGYSVAAVVDLCYMPAALHVRKYVCTSLVTWAATCVILFCPSSAYHGRTSSERVSCLTLL
jgi:hypothetical protein